MTWEEWERQYPPKKARSEPPRERLAHPTPFPTYREAESQREFNEGYHECAGMIVVEWNGKFYVVYEEFTDWELGNVELDKFKDALKAGRVEFSTRAEAALANFDFTNPDRTLTSVSVHFWGRWRKDWPDGTQTGNDGGIGIDYTFRSAGCGRCDIYVQDGKLKCYNQGEKKEFILKLLEFVVGNMELEDDG